MLGESDAPEHIYQILSADVAFFRQAFRFNDLIEAQAFIRVLSDVYPGSRPFSLQGCQPSIPHEDFKIWQFAKVIFRDTTQQRLTMQKFDQYQDKIRRTNRFNSQSEVSVVPPVSLPAPTAEALPANCHQAAAYLIEINQLTFCDQPLNFSAPEEIYAARIALSEILKTSVSSQLVADTGSAQRFSIALAIEWLEKNALLFSCENAQIYKFERIYRFHLQKALFASNQDNSIPAKAAAIAEVASDQGIASTSVGEVTSAFPAAPTAINLVTVAYFLSDKQIFSHPVSLRNQEDADKLGLALRLTLSQQVRQETVSPSTGIPFFCVSNAVEWLLINGMTTWRSTTFKLFCPAGYTHINSEMQSQPTSDDIQNAGDAALTTLENHHDVTGKAAGDSTLEAVNDEDISLIAGQAESEVTAIEHAKVNRAGDDVVWQEAAYPPTYSIFRLSTELDRWCHGLRIIGQFNEGGVVLSDNPLQLRNFKQFLAAQGYRVWNAGELSRLPADWHRHFYVARNDIRQETFELQFSLHLHLPLQKARYLQEAALDCHYARFIDSFLLHRYADLRYFKDFAETLTQTNPVKRTQVFASMEEVRHHCAEHATPLTSLRLPELTTTQQNAIRAWLSYPVLDRLELECPDVFELAYATEYTGFGRGSNVIYECKSTGADFPAATIRAMTGLLQARYPLNSIDLITFVAPTRSGGIVERFAHRVGAALAKPCTTLLVKEAREKQKNLTTRADKVRNVQGAFRPAQKLTGQSVLVLDDVFDSGLTLAEVGRTLKRGGAGKLYAATIASTPLGD